MLSPLERSQFLKIYIFASSEIVLSPIENSNILENRFFALLKNRAFTNGKEPILENPCFRNLRNRAPTHWNNNILENDCFAIPKFVLSPMEIAMFLKIINFCLHTSCHAAFSKIVSSPMVRTRILHFELRAQQPTEPCWISKNACSHQWLGVEFFDFPVHSRFSDAQHRLTEMQGRPRTRSVIDFESRVKFILLGARSRRPFTDTSSNPRDA